MTVPRYKDGAQIFEWVPGTLSEALEKGKWLLFDEINLAPPEVLECIAPLLQRQQSLNKGTAGNQREGEGERRKPRIFATMNPVSVGGGRSALPRSILQHFTVVHIPPHDEKEFQDIMKCLFREFIAADGGSTGILQGEHLSRLYNIHKEVDDACRKQELDGAHQFTLRDAAKVRDIFAGNWKHYRDHCQLHSAEQNASGV